MVENFLVQNAIFGWLSADKEALIHLGSFNFKFYNGQFYASFHSITVLRKSNASKMHEFHSLFLQLFDTIFAQEFE